VRVRYLVAGVVQGVGFRHFVWRQGSRLGLSGWVRNLSDGRVEAVAEGESDPLSRFEAALREGPRLARVERVETSRILDEAELPSSFEIR